MIGFSLLFDKYPREITSDFREYYSISAYQAGEAYSWREAFDLLESLSFRTETAIGAALSELKFRASKNDIVAIQHFIVAAAVAGVPSGELGNWMKSNDPRPDKKPEKKIKGPVHYMKLEDAKVKFEPKITTKTPEEIIQKNNEFMKKQKAQALIEQINK
jgi:hypothetical protein